MKRITGDSMPFFNAVRNTADGFRPDATTLLLPKDSRATYLSLYFCVLTRAWILMTITVVHETALTFLISELIIHYTEV